MQTKFFLVQCLVRHRVWMNRGYIAHDEVTGRYCKTEAYLKRVRV